MRVGKTQDSFICLFLKKDQKSNDEIMSSRKFLGLASGKDATLNTEPP